MLQCTTDSNKPWAQLQTRFGQTPPYLEAGCQGKRLAHLYGDCMSKAVMLKIIMSDLGAAREKLRGAAGRGAVLQLEGNSRGVCRRFGLKRFSCTTKQEQRGGSRSVARYPGRPVAQADQAWRSKELRYVRGETESSMGQDGEAPEGFERAERWMDDHLCPSGYTCTDQAVRRSVRSICPSWLDLVNAVKTFTFIRSKIHCILKRAGLSGVYGFCFPGM